MSRPLWKGAISFSLIHIPVELYPASRTNTLDLDLLDKRDFSPVGYQRINKNTGKAVDWKNIVKGYRHGDDGYVVLTDEDFRLANVEATQTVDIQGFVQAGDIGPEYFDTPYHLLPVARGEKVFRLFLDALQRSETVALGLIVIRSRQHPCALFARDTSILLNTLRFATEILEPSQPESQSGKRAGVRGARSTVQEGTMAIKLIESMKQAWEPEAFRDSYQEDLLKRVGQKIRAGQARQLTAAEKGERAPRGSNVIDLTQLLKRSLEQKKLPQRRERAATRNRRHRG